MNITQSDRLPRWFTPPPARTAAFWRVRSPGVVFRVSQIRADPPDAAASANRLVMLAIPERWHRKFRAVRSPVRIDAIGPLTVPTITSARDGVAVRRRPRQLDGGVELREHLGGAERPRQHAVVARDEVGDGTGAVGQERRRQVAQRRQVLGQGQRDRGAHGVEVGIGEHHDR